MRRLLILTLITLLWGAFIPSPESASAQGTVAARQDALLFAGGGTPVTSGVFFPGTAVCDASGCQGLPPLQVDKGANVSFTNLDVAAVTNGHQIRCFKMKHGRPVCQSDLVNGPGSTVMITSHLKAGKTYTFFCTIHTSMFGRFEIVKP